MTSYRRRCLDCLQNRYDKKLRSARIHIHTIIPTVLDSEGDSHLGDHLDGTG